jgi:hypothetical protein
VLNYAAGKINIGGGLCKRGFAGLEKMAALFQEAKWHFI